MIKYKCKHADVEILDIKMLTEQDAENFISCCRNVFKSLVCYARFKNYLADAASEECSEAAMNTQRFLKYVNKVSRLVGSNRQTSFEFKACLKNFVEWFLCCTALCDNSTHIPSCVSKAGLLWLFYQHYPTSTVAPLGTVGLFQFLKTHVKMFKEYIIVYSSLVTSTPFEWIPTGIEPLDSLRYFQNEPIAMDINGFKSQTESVIQTALRNLLSDSRIDIPDQFNEENIKKIMQEIISSTSSIARRKQTIMIFDLCNVLLSMQSMTIFNPPPSWNR